MENSGPDEYEYLTFNTEVLQILQANGLSPADVLKKAGVYGLKPVPDPAVKPGQRDIMMILLGSSAVIAASTPLITRVIATVVNRPVVVHKRELTPALDGNGAAILNENGQPVVRWLDVSEVDRGPAAPDLPTKIGATKTGIEIGIGQS